MLLQPRAQYSRDQNHALFPPSAGTALFTRAVNDQLALVFSIASNLDSVAVAGHSGSVCASRCGGVDFLLHLGALQAGSFPAVPVTSCDEKPVAWCTLVHPWHCERVPGCLTALGSVMATRPPW